MPTDTELLDWLQKQNNKKSYTGKCVWRMSTTGRDRRLGITQSNDASSIDSKRRMNKRAKTNSNKRDRQALNKELENLVSE